MQKTMQTKIQEVIDRTVENGEVAGANVLVLIDGKEVAYAEGGYKNIEKKTPFSRNTIMRLYSMSKPITSAAVIKLMEEGRIDLCDNVSRYLPSFSDMTYLDNGTRKKVVRPMLLKDLMNMTSGAVYPGVAFTEAEKQSKALFDEIIGKLNTDKEMTTAEIADRIGKNDLEFTPGATFEYGTSADILGAVIEKVSGMKLGEYLKKTFFEPLNMDDTGFWVPSEKRDRLADVYNLKDGKLVLEETMNLGINYPMDHSPAFESSGAGLCSTLDDYARFATMLMNDGEYKGSNILSPRAVDYMTKGRLLPWQQSGMNSWDGLAGYTYSNLLRVLVEPGCCMTLGEIGEYGWDGWLGPYFSNDPGNRLTILMGMQKVNAGTWGMTREIRNVIYSFLY